MKPDQGAATWWLARRLVIGVLTVVLAGCISEPMTGSSTVNGTYTLRTINGSALPYTVAGAGADKTEIIDDAYTLYEGGTYAQSGHTRNTVSGQATNQTNTETGSYAALGTSVTLQSSDRTSTTIASISGNTMTIVESGLTSVYSK